MEKRILIDESRIVSGLEIPTRFQSFSEIRNGIFNSIERIIHKNQNCHIYYKNGRTEFAKAFLSRHPFIKLYNDEEIDEILEPDNFEPWKLISNTSKSIQEDLEEYKRTKKWKNQFKVNTDKFQIVGKSKHLYIHETAKIYPNVVFDTSSGPVIIDRDVKITPFSFLEGPLYVGNSSQLDNVKIGGGTIIGSTCRLGGEIENSIIGDFTNKHHEGFLGHSYVGSWVNIGALATTSDLKNNYGVVSIRIGENKIDTGTIKFGSIIGDYSKIAIGVMLNTGCTIDVCSNIVSSRISGYTNAFTWKENEKYNLEKFLNDAKKIMARRDKTLSDESEILLRRLYESL
ncbi:MAG: glucose-1-phosphate thymidylyltransferase [Leptospiraceae bacterium]|nr:glucose-1-phosphate thymidylyltransferase [Leptospiraceae bacterium]